MIGLHHMLTSPVELTNGQPNIVRVAAKTAPQIVSSVPKCRNPKGSRSRPDEPARGRQVVAMGRSGRPFPVEDQVLLIVNDDHVRGGGVPVIGRRLPSKSMSAVQAELKRVQHYRQQSSPQDYSIRPSMKMGEPEAAQPVIGRRTHRLQLAYQMEQHQLERARELCQPLSIIDTSLNDITSREQQIQAAGARMADKYRRQISHPALNLAEQQRAPARGQRRGRAQPANHLLQAQQVERRPRLDLEPISSSCSSLCCTEGRRGYLQSSEPPNYVSPCSSPLVTDWPPACCSSSQQPMSSCCLPPVSVHSGKLGRSLSCQRVGANCYQNGQLPEQAYMERPTLHQQHNSRRVDGRSISQSANGSQQHVHRPSGELEKRNRMGPARPSRAPVYSPSGARFASPSSREPPAAESAVSQMYESLAAELKAKLGDPKMGPILLPPKDYDTMSRRQGKLTGIELRRSTNPQLVGPTANRASSREPGQQQLVTKIGQISEGSVDSARSSGRSATDQSADTEIQRSRSNSSSGLGSIRDSGSPNSCPSSSSSSNEDFHGNLASREAQIASRQHGKQPLPASASISASSGLSSASSASPISPNNSASSDSGLEARATSNQSNDNNLQLKTRQTVQIDLRELKGRRGRDTGAGNNSVRAVSSGLLWNGRVEVPLKINSDKNGNTYLATKQIIY